METGGLVGLDLNEAEFTGANLTEADLKGANLRGATLTDANLTRASLEGAFLIEARFNGASLVDAHLARAEFLETFFTNTDLRCEGPRGVYQVASIIEPLPDLAACRSRFFVAAACRTSSSTTCHRC